MLDNKNCSDLYLHFFIQICNAVAVAGFLNATLVIPNFHYHSIWRDPRFSIFFFTQLLVFYVAILLVSLIPDIMCSDINGLVLNKQ